MLSLWWLQIHLNFGLNPGHSLLLSCHPEAHMSCPPKVPSVSMCRPPSSASAGLDLEGRPHGRSTSLSCSLRWQGRWHIPHQGTQCRSHEINMNSQLYPMKPCAVSSSQLHSPRGVCSGSDTVRLHVIWFTMQVCVRECVFVSV